MENRIDNPIQLERKAAESVPKITTHGALDCFDLPKNIKNLTILDIGAGFSGNVIKLQKKGAKAIAIDYAYEDLDQLRETTLHMPFADNSWKFTEAHKKGGIKAVAAFAGHLPFAGNSADICLSAYSIDELAKQDRNVLIGAVKEALRVLKPGGNLQIFPWVTDLDLTLAKQNKEALLEYLKINKLPFRIENPEPKEVSDELDKSGIPPMYRLKIIKPGSNKSPSFISSLVKRLRG